MATRVDPSSVSIAVTTRPTVTTPAVSGANMAFGSTPIRATGTARLVGAAGDVATGWTLGFLQAQWIETNWRLYRGVAEADGSVFHQVGHPPARPAQACRDTVQPAPAVWYNSNKITPAAAGAAAPVTLTTTHFD